jgi:glycosyltransferase involved in cell wall biosynthesis
MKRLARLFELSGVDGLLVTTGYQKSFFGMPKRSARVLPLVLEERQDVLDAIAEANCYVMHSAHEGFGLVLLEAMLNRTPWLANAVGGAMQLAEFGNVYRSDTELVDLLGKFSRDEAQVSRAYRYVREHHSIELAVDDLEQAALTTSKAGAVCEGRKSSRFFGLQRRPS